EIHKKLMIRLNPKIAGKIRNCRIYVGGFSEYKECLKPKYVTKKLEEWVKNSNIKEESECPPSERAKKAHIVFENIHPFKDGNGRLGRILMNVQRLNAELPLLVIYEKEKQDYYKWFEQDTNNKCKDFRDPLADLFVYGVQRWKEK
ncbi:MAG: Fic family protein, partial [Nanoarchaeota archaeon]